MIKRYHQIICDNCSCVIDNIESRVKLSYRQIKSRGTIISKGKHFCNEKCKKDFSFMEEMKK